MAPASCRSSPHISIRTYNEITDAKRVDEVEKLCEAGPSGSVSLFTDLLGDPLCRVRHFPAYAMLVAEAHTGVDAVEIVGMIRAGMKQVICGKPSASEAHSEEGAADGPGLFVPIAYILGLRVHPQYRRLGIGVELVKQMEAWCKAHGAQYTYIATEKDNEASVNLFTQKLGYSMFRTPAILVQPVYTRSKIVSSRVKIVEVSREKAEALYRGVFKEREFFPKDVDAIMRSKLHKGTWVAVWGGEKRRGKAEKKQVRSVAEEEEEECSSPASWAVLSIWKCNEIFKLQVKGAPFHTRLAVAAARLLGKLLLKVGTLPTPPNVFKPFGLQLLYGMHAHGAKGPELLRELCWFAHNLAKKDGCALVAAEVGSRDPLRACIPHWPSISCDEDLWCIKRLSHCHDCTTPGGGDFHLSPSITAAAATAAASATTTVTSPSSSLFVDPRDF